MLYKSSRKKFDQIPSMPAYRVAYEKQCCLQALNTLQNREFLLRLCASFRVLIQLVRTFSRVTHRIQIYCSKETIKKQIEKKHFKHGRER